MNSNHRQGKRSDMTAIAVTVIAVVVMFAGQAVPAQAQTPTVLYSFAGFNGDACSPRGNIVQGRDGNMYGGGAAACGAPAAARSTRFLRREWRARFSASRGNGSIVVALG